MKKEDIMQITLMCLFLLSLILLIIFIKYICFKYSNFKQIKKMNYVFKENEKLFNELIESIKEKDDEL